MIESVKHGGRHVFEIGIFGSKIALIFVLLILSFVNADTSFVSTNGRAFLGESIVVGMSAAVPFTFIASNRGRELGDAVSLGITAFLIFFLFHVVMEFSGENKAQTNGELTKTEKAQQDFLAKTLNLKPVKALIGIVFGVMFLLAMVIRDTGGLGFGTIMSEGFLMAICGALPTVMIALDRKETNKTKIVKDFFIYFIAFFVAHLTLQFGGFYTHTFMKKPDEVNKTSNDSRTNTVRT